MKNFIEDLIYEFKSKSASLSDLPENMRALKLLTSQSQIFKTYVLNGDELQSLSAINGSWSNYEIVDGGRQLSYHVKANDIVGGKKYPSVKNLRILYNRIGIKDVLKEIEIKGKKNYKSQLESFFKYS